LRTKGPGGKKKEGNNTIVATTQPIKGRERAGHRRHSGKRIVGKVLPMRIWGTKGGENIRKRKEGSRNRVVILLISLRGYGGTVDGRVQKGSPSHHFKKGCGNHLLQPESSPENLLCFSEKKKKKTRGQIHLFEHHQKKERPARTQRVRSIQKKGGVPARRGPGARRRPGTEHGGGEFRREKRHKGAGKVVHLKVGTGGSKPQECQKRAYPFY